MEEASASSPSFWARFKKLLPRYVIAFALAALGLLAFRQLSYLPQRAIAHTRYRSHLALMRLYDLQVAYHAKHGFYAKDLDTLLASSEDGARFRENLKTVIDINTLLVTGDERRFRLEVNVLDPQRTAVKIRGPL